MKIINAIYKDIIKIAAIRCTKIFICYICFSWSYKTYPFSPCATCFCAVIHVCIKLSPSAVTHKTIESLHSHCIRVAATSCHICKCTIKQIRRNASRTIGSVCCSVIIITMICFYRIKVIVSTIRHHIFCNINISVHDIR